MPIPRLVLVLAATALAGCADLLAERIWDGERVNSVTPTEFSAFAASGPRVEILGAPPGGASAEEVVAALRMPGRFRNAPFRLVETGSEATTTQGMVRLVFAFGAAGAANGRPLCAGQPSGASAQGPKDGLEVTAALCIGRQVDAAARLSHRDPLAPGDPAFTATMARLIDVLAPRSQEFRDRRGMCLIPPC